MTQPLSESDIIFPHLSNTPNFSSTLSSLKRSALSITNRLNSISKDSEFISNVAAAYDLPLVANERCGSWYIPLDLKAASVYFKSTDGHMGEWAFSLRRLNLQLLDVVSQHGGCVVVDSTRRGKSMPDALSKTVPFWSCVINRAVFGGERKGDEALGLFTPPAAVSESENVQMERRVDGFVQQFLDICKPDISALRAKLQKPLRPLWVTQTSTLPHSTPDFPDFHPIILCTASRRVRGAEASEGGYIQGAADDHEAWSHGLTPSLFWNHKDTLLHTNEEDLPGKITQLVSEERGADAIATLIRPTTTLYVSASQNIDLTPFDVVVSCTPTPLPHASLKTAGVKAYLHLPCQLGKLGSRDLRALLPALHRLSSSSSLASPPAGAPNTLICCPTGKDLAVGTALAYLCLFTTDTGAVDLQSARETRRIDKTLVKQRLSWITTSEAALNPSRATLQSVNAALMSSHTAPAHALPVVRDPARCDAAWTPLALGGAPGAAPGEELAALALDRCCSATDTPTAPLETPVSPRSKKALGDANLPTTTPPPSPPSPQQRLFTRLQSVGSWTFTRHLTSALPSHPSGTVTGTASFSPTGVEGRLVYAEEGTFRTEGGVEMRVRRGYVYCLCSSAGGAAGEAAGSGGAVSKADAVGGGGGGSTSSAGAEGLATPQNTNPNPDADAAADADADPHIAVHFLDDTTHTPSPSPPDAKPGALFVAMGPLSPTPSPGVHEATNRERHLCGQDLYAARWRFSGAMLGPNTFKQVGDEGEERGDEWWQVRYDVQGPKKGYVSETRYERVE